LLLAGAGDDSIVVSNSGATVTGGDGKDTIDVSADLYSAAADITTITDFVLGTDKITLNDKGTEVFNATKVDISAATTLETALGLAIGNVDGSTNANITWFQYGGNTFIVENQTAAGVVTDANATDIVVKLTGLVDLTNASFNGTYGTIGIDSSGQWTYTLDNTRAATQALNAGDTRTETFTARVTDEHGAYSEQTITVTVSGSNDVPTGTGTATCFLSEMAARPARCRLTSAMWTTPSS